MSEDRRGPVFGTHNILFYFSHMSGPKYLLGDYDTKRDKFLVTAAAEFNFGAETPAAVHAPSAAPDGKGGVLVTFNMNPGFRRPPWAVPFGSQLMALPRRLTLDGKGELRMEPAGDADEEHL